jgi:hypothetical protein
MYSSIIILILVLIGVILLFCKRNFESAFDPNTIQYKTPENFKATSTPGNPRVLIFNTVAYPENKLPEYADYSTEINRLYAQKHGYDYIQIQHDQKEAPPYWLRVKDLNKLLEEDQYDIIVYMDLDAVFYDFEKPLTSIISDEYDFFIGRDPPVFFRDIGKLVNTGCFIVRNTPWSKRFSKEWLYSCVDDNNEFVGVCKNDWRQLDGKWKCPGCKWAGIKYEQGSLANLYLLNIENAQKHMCIFREEVLSNTYTNINSYVLHLMSSSDKKRIDVFKNILAKKLKKYN